jgi:hypothetical protein
VSSIHTLDVDLLNWFSFINVDFFLILRFECFMETNWHTRVYLMGSVAACCLAGTASFFLFGRERKATKDQPVERNNIFVRLLEKTSWLLMVVGYLIYPVRYTC